jgi:uncharacterized protein
MDFENPSTDQIYSLIRETATIAVIGLSPKPERPSHGVARALKDLGYRIIPVRPGVDEILGEKAYPDLAEIPLSLRDEIDLVQVFRRPEHVDSVVERCIELGLKAIWMQDGVINDYAAEMALTAGMTVVMDRCFYRDRLALLRLAG